MSSSRIFITHSSLDQELADSLVQALRLGANLGEQHIFCSSVEGLGIPTGEEFLQYIREQLEGTQLVIPLVTPAYLDSTFCSYELGAAWVRQVPLFPIAVPPVSRAGLPGPLGARQVAVLNKAGLNECLKKVCAAVPDSSMSPQWERYRDALLSQFQQMQERLTAVWAGTAVAVQRRKARTADAMRSTHRTMHLIRDAAFLRLVSGDDARSLLQHLSGVTEAMREAFELTTGASCRVVLKQLQLVDDKLIVFDLRRSPGKTRKAPDAVKDNSDFESICAGLVAYFKCDDVHNAGPDYRNSSSSTPAELSYRSTIVWPIRKWLDDPTDADKLDTLVEDQDLVGFLCVDSPTPAAFSEADVQLGAAFADTLYPLLRPYLMESSA